MSHGPTERPPSTKPLTSVECFLQYRPTPSMRPKKRTSIRILMNIRPSPFFCGTEKARPGLSWDKRAGCICSFAVPPLIDIPSRKYPLQVSGDSPVNTFPLSRSDSVAAYLIARWVRRSRDVFHSFLPLSRITRQVSEGIMIPCTSSRSSRLWKE